MFVHGFRGDHHGMQLIVDALPEFEVVVPDLPGFNATEPVRDPATGATLPHTLSTYHRFVEAVAAHLGFTTDDVLFGHSFGTIVTAAHIASGVRDWAGLVLSAPISDPVFSGRLLPGACGVELYYALSRLLPEAGGNALLRSRFAMAVTNLTIGVDDDPLVRAFVKDQHHRYFGTYTDRQTLLQAYRASSRHTVTEVADRLNLPVLLVAGAKDQLSTRAGRAALQQRLPHARMELVRNTGHLIHYERPAQLARAMRRFISDLEASDVVDGDSQRPPSSGR
ncbi:alpha/beta fold hydrolase [Nesterenkonia alba]|uniref:alpha/beta fold hydrolase n=1 Tax=Nesterenkonia alba TaxID=515814 RepID=UPI0024817008|nr:alpha/beta hydrolase [Nesterenkonia alba]